MNTTTSEPQVAHTSPGAIVLGGNFVGLGVVRSLGRHGIPAWVIDSDRSKSICQFSRHTKRFIESHDNMHDLLIREGRAHRLDRWMIFPVNDDYVELLATHHESLSSIYRLTTPPLEITRFALDKRLTYSKAAELGIDSPWTLVCKEAVDSATARNISYPVILKPAVNHHFFPQTNIKAIAVDNASDLQRRHAQMSKYIPADEILIQERIPGGGQNQFSFCAICDNGRVRATLVAQRRRQYPVEFGNASSFVETASQPVVEAGGRRFLESIGYDGIAEVEFKFDVRDGKYKILDVNPRPWGWHTLTAAAGTDFVYLLWCLKNGLPPIETNPPRNAAWLREITDFIAIARSADRKGELQSIVQAFRRGRLTLAAFDALDPMPFFAEFALWASKGLSRQKKAQEFLGE